MIRPIIQWPNPVLTNATQPWNFINVPIDYGQLETDLRETLVAAQGLGLAANQIGIPYRVLAIHIQKDNSIRIMYNPEILYKSLEQEEILEGCLSFSKIRLSILRSTAVTVRYLDKNQFIHSVDLTGIDARCILHELDHLDGRVFKEYVSELKFKRAMKNK